MPGVDMLSNSTLISKSLLLAIVIAPLLGAILAGVFRKQVGRIGAQSATILGVAASAPSTRTRRGRRASARETACA